MAENNEMKTYDFIEGTEFNGLMSKAIDAAPGVVGDSAIGTKFMNTVHGSDSMAMVDIWAFYENSNSGGGSGDDSGSESGSTDSGSTESGSTESGGTESGSTESGGTESGSTEPEIVKPEETPNTQEQQQVADDMANALTDESAGTKAYSAVVESINNITVPSEAGRSATISGDVQNGATITNESTGKYVTITGTQNDPVDVSVVTSGGSVYLRGEYNDIYLEGKSLPVSSSVYPNVHGTISVADTDQPVSVTVNFVGEDCGIDYLGDEKLTVSDGVADVIASPTIYAPNATVEIGGKYDEVTATVSENTLILKSGFHANKLTILKGNIHVNGLDIAEFVDELIAPADCVITYNEFHATQSDTSKLMSSSLANGKIILDEDIELTKGRTLGTLASGKEVIDLNGHTWKCGDSRTGNTTGSFYLRGTANVTLEDNVGGGKFINNHEDYLIWAGANGVVVNINSGEYQGYTHVLYAYAGTINVYGGTFKMLGENEDRDVNGNYKFLLNCYDANYTGGTAHINVYGGKFYEFNPAVSYGEPGGPVSFVAEGYKVVESVEDGVKVYEVVKE